MKKQEITKNPAITTKTLLIKIIINYIMTCLVNKTKIIFIILVNKN
jgi:hypothetical protein